MGSEDPLQIFSKGIFVQEGPSGTRFDHYLKLKPSLFIRFPAILYNYTRFYVAWASFHFEMWEGQSVSEVFAGVQGAGPLAGVVRGKRPLA